MPANFAPSATDILRFPAGNDPDHRGYAGDGSRSAVREEVSAKIFGHLSILALIVAIFAAAAANSVPASPSPTC